MVRCRPPWLRDDASMKHGAQVRRALAAVAEEADPAIVIRIEPERPVVVWANSAAEDLLGAERATWFAPQELHAADGPRLWSAVVTGLVARPGAEAEQWHRACVRRCGASGAPVQVRLGSLDQAPDLRLVRLRGVSDAAADALEAVAEAEFRFRSLAENAPVGIVVSEVGARLAFANDSFAEVAGTTREALLGVGWLDIFDGAGRSALLEALEDVLAGAARDLTQQVRKPGAAPRWVQLRLSPVVTRQRAAGFVGTVEDITVRRGRELELSYHASHDSLTGQLNRRQMVETLAAWLASRRRSERALAVLFCDLDGFKQVNDTYGHEAGDRVLIEVARRMSTTARDDDLVARISGDEFVIVLRHVTEEGEARAGAERFLHALRRPVQLGGERGAVTAHVSMSIGIALALEDSTVEGLLRDADAAMYAAKQTGGGIGCAGITASPHPVAASGV